MPAQIVPSEYPSKIYEAAISIVQAKFPDYLQGSDSKISTSRSLGPNINGQYNPSTKNIEIAAPEDGTRAFTTDNVISQVGTILHELYHSRDMGKEGQKTSPDRSHRKLMGGENDLKYWAKSYEPVIDAAEQQYLPSVNKSAMFGNMQEIMATAVPTLDMRDRGIQGQYLKNIEQIIRDIPEMENVIKANKYPEVPTFKALPDPGPNWQAALQRLLTGK
jgi:hypothetical protein